MTNIRYNYAINGEREYDNTMAYGRDERECINNILRHIEKFGDDAYCDDVDDEDFTGLNRGFINFETGEYCLIDHSKTDEY